MYIATLHSGYVSAPPRGLMTGRSISSAWITTRVATRFGFGLTDGSAVSEGEGPGGGKVGGGRVGAGSAETIVGLGSADPNGSAADALPARLSRPAESSVTPVAVTNAGRRRSRGLRPRVLTGSAS